MNPREAADGLVWPAISRPGHPGSHLSLEVLTPYCRYYRVLSLVAGAREISLELLNSDARVQAALSKVLMRFRSPTRLQLSIQQSNFFE